MHIRAAMHALVVQNYQNTGLGQVGRALAEVNCSIDHCNAYLGESLPDSHGGHDAIVILGGDQNALDDEAYPYLPQLADLIRKFGDADKAVLGICLGSQLVARGYGATNILGKPVEFGWKNVLCTAEAASDPMFSAVAEQFPIFHWHSDTFTLPAKAIHLASSGMTVNQAFRIGRAVYGIQFHFEADTHLVEEWKHVFHDQIAGNHADWLAHYADNAARDADTADAAGLALARAWVALI